MMEDKDYEIMCLKDERDLYRKALQGVVASNNSTQMRIIAQDALNSIATEEDMKRFEDSYKDH